MRKMHVLMTNDDGYEAPGIKALASAISEFARITEHPIENVVLARVL